MDRDYAKDKTINQEDIDKLDLAIDNIYQIFVDQYNNEISSTMLTDENQGRLDAIFNSFDENQKKYINVGVSAKIISQFTVKKGVK